METPRDHDATARGRPVPVPMLPFEIVPIGTAMLIAGVCDKTIRAWVKKDGIGRQSDRCAALQISAPALCMKIDGQKTLLERFRDGEREDPGIQFYIRRAEALVEYIGARDFSPLVKN